MTMKSPGNGSVGVAKPFLSSFKARSVRKMLFAMTVKDAPDLPKPAVKARVGAAPSRTVKLSNGMVLKMVRPDVYNRVVRGRAA